MNTGRRLTIVAVVASAGLLLLAEPASAKILPADSVTVETPQPRARQPVAVVVRFGDGFDLGDYAWETAEVSLLPAARTDAEGWPLDRNDRGVPVNLRRVGKGVYRGSFVVTSPGDYVVVDWSSVAAKRERATGVVPTRTYPMPVKLHVGAATTNSNTVLRSGLIALFGALVGAGVALPLLRRRRRVATRAVPADAGPPDRVGVTAGARQG